MKLLAAYAALTWSMTSVAAVACSLPEPGANLPVSQAADCSFVNAGDRDIISGGPVRDLGEGRMYQVIDLYFHKPALVVDCARGEAALVYGKIVRTLGTCGNFTDVTPFLHPAGALDLSRGDTLADLAGSAKRLGFETHLSTGDLTGFDRPSDRVDIFCGCKASDPNYKTGKNG